jgi:hypothetical protein
MDFSVNSTRMPEAPNTVGRDIVSPVQEQAMTTNIVPALSNIADIFMKGYAADKKAEADAFKQSVLGDYARKQAAINEAIASGEMNPDVAATRSRALFSKTMAGYTQFADDIHKINNSMRSGSELGVAEDAVKSAAETQKARENSARANGVTIYPWMDAATKEVMLQTNEASIRAEREWKQKHERNVEQRAMSAEERTVIDRERKEDALKMVTDIAGNNITSSSAFIQGLSAKVSQGTIPADQAAIMMTQHFSQIEAAIQAASGLNPEIASPYRSLFTDLKALGTKAIDPKTSSETSKAMFDEIMYRAKLVAVTSDPALKATVVANSLLGGSPVTALMSIKPITDYIDKASRIDSSKGEGYVPQIVGNPDVEKDVLKFLNVAIKKVNEGGYADNPKAEKEAITSVNNILKQTADLQNDPTAKQNPEKLAEMAKFYASPEYGAFMAKGKINPQAAQAAKQTWQATYDPAVQQSIQKRLSAWETSLASQSGGGVRGVKLTEAIDIKYDGSGISFVPKKSNVAMEPYQQKQQEASIAELNAVKAGINQSIRIGAHMEGSTDYNKYWEENKHLYVPQLYPARIGTIVNGYKYKGGVYTDPSNWTKVE